MMYRETWAEIDLQAIQKNIQALKNIQASDTHIMAVVKADGYGHGAVKTAEAALDAGASHLGTALMEEAVSLREAGIRAPIVVLGRTSARAATYASEHNIALTAFQTDWLAEAEKHVPTDHTLQIHVKFDSGMGRLGVRTVEELENVLNRVGQADRIEIQGLFTHLATADELEERYFNEQMVAFERAVKVAKQKLGYIPYIHCANSAAAMRFPNACYNMVRFGISMYGLLPSEELCGKLPFTLSPSMSLYSTLTHVKRVTKGSGISYGATFIAEEDTWIGTVPVGYGDGWIRANAKKGTVLVDGERMPIVGRICMDQFMVKLPRPMAVGSKVTLIGGDGDEAISIEEVAGRLDTITYEIPCLLNSRIPRIYT
ncbi:alanine racemase [Geomicrobium sp. JCM 19037]|uniref:alanine racemase n=1 Tax=unclassified Geomicrobium TaxID=2628951 RepID=UPI00045F339A|nr:alanine racemase [Geomicrobium sp. JCM 19037]GAK04400.1 alanine racemase [Geomicrobium sp. JCM 19037]